MRWILTAVIIVLLFTAPVHSDIHHNPEHSFLWNSFGSVRILDSHAVATTEYGLLLLQLDHQTGLYQPVDHLLLDTRPCMCKLYDNVAVVQSYANILYFVDLSDQTALSLLGEADLVDDFHDFALFGQDLYIAHGFDGLWRYELNQFADPVFVDSSMIGIHLIQVEIVGDVMLALDDYNGLIRYDLSGDGFGELIDFFYISQQAQSFLISDSTVIFPIAGKRQFLLGEYTSEGPVVDDIINLTAYPRQNFTVDTLLVTLDPTISIMTVINLNNLTSLRVALPDDLENEPDGCSFLINDTSSLVLPTVSGGLIQYALNDLWFDDTPRQIYARPGPVTDMFFFDDWLFTGGWNNPLEVYAFDDNDRPYFDTAMYGLNNVAALDHSGSMIFALYPEVESVFLMQFNGERIQTVNVLPIDPTVVHDIKYHYKWYDTAAVLLTIGLNKVSIYTVDKNWEFHPTDTVKTFGVILDVLIHWDKVLISTNKYQLYCYQVRDDFSLEPVWTVGTPGKLEHITTVTWDAECASGITGSISLAFAGSSMYELDLETGEIAFIQSYPFNVHNSVQVCDLLYTTGDQGIGMIRLDSDPPELVEYGGFGGHLIATDNSILAVSNGSAIHLYNIEEGIPTDIPDPSIVKTPSVFLLQNYPNPFNPSTNIQYSLSAAAKVELSVFNILGRHIVMLEYGSKTAGSHSVTWNGTDYRGNQVASGVYFYRLITSEGTETRKMLLIR